MSTLGKRILAMLCAVVMMMSFVVLPENGLRAEAAEGLSLSGMQIVLPASATTLERTAASELQTYIGKITGSNPAIVSEGNNSGAGIYVGKTTYAKTNAVKYPTSDSNGEGWAIQVVGQNVVLVGAPTRGVLYAVYHFLEDVLGVHWWNIWEEYIPSGNVVIPADYADSGVPAMEYREIYIGTENTTDYPYYARNRINGNITHIPSSYGGNEVYGFAHVHTFNRYFTSADFASNPEWFSQVSGSRVSDGQLCLTNAALKTEFAARLKNQISGNPQAIYSVSPNDNTRFCECSSCQSAINTYGYSGYILNFVNEMAQAVSNAGYTGATIEMLVYWAYLDAPKGGVTPNSNVQIRFADNYTDLLHGINHANNADTKANLQAWVNIASNNVYFWQYVVNYGDNGIVPSMFYYGDDFTTIQSMGINGWFAEQEQCINTDFWDMKQWLIAKLMEEPVSGDEYTALMDEFIYGYYGEAAGRYVREYLYYMHEKAEATSASKDFGDDVITMEWLTVQDILKGYELMEKAAAAAGTDATLQRRILAARSGLDRAIVQNFAKWKTQASSAGLTLPFTQREAGQRVAKNIDLQIALRGSHDTNANTVKARYDSYGTDQPALPSSLSIDAGHYMETTAEDMLAAGAGFSVVSDSDSLTGKAIYGDPSQDDSLALSYSFSKYTLYYYNGSTEQSDDIGNIYGSSIKYNEGYQLYSFSWTVPSTINDSDFIYLFGSWGFQNRSLPGMLRSFAGQSVTVYLNMKVVNKPYGSGAAPQIYIDRMIVVPYSQLTHSYSAVTDPYGTGCKTVCSICGDTQQTPHTWNEGEIITQPTVDAEGEKKLTCTSCGSTMIELIEKLQPTRESFMPAELANVHSGHMKIYNAEPNFRLDGGGSIVSDINANTGKAFYAAGKDLGNNLEVYRYGRDDGEQYVKLLAVPAAEVKFNEGYQYYKSTVTLPESFKSSVYTYVDFGGWICQNYELSRDLADYAGKTVDFYISLRADGNADSADVYIDRMILVDRCEDHKVGYTCSVCGKELLDETLPEELRRLDEKHITRYSAADNFKLDGGGEIKDDAGAYTGKAFYAAGKALGSKLEIYRYAGASNQYINLMSIPAAEVSFDGEYHFYSNRITVPEDIYAPGTYTYVDYGGWICQNYELCNELAKYAGKQVEFYISLKAVGNASSADVYIDQMILVDCCENHKVNFACSVCGKELIDETLPEELQRLDEKHITRYYAEPHFKLDGGGSITDDAEAYSGKAFYKAGQDLGSWLSVYRYSGSTGQYVNILDIPASEVVFDGQYHFYKQTTTIQADIAAAGTYAYVDFGGWICQNYQLSSDLVQYAGKTVDFYISLKAVGNDSSATVYVDQMILVDSCENHKVGHNCSVCGRELLDETLPEELRLMDLKHISRYDVTNFSTENAGSITSDENAYGGRAYYAAGLAVGSKIEVYRYAASGADFDHQYLKLLEISAENLQFNQGYVFYKSTVTVPSDIVDGNFVYVDYAGWKALNTSLASALKTKAGKTVDFYLSMKVDGSAESGNIYIDQMILVDHCDDSWDAGVITTKPTVDAEGVKTYTCTVCGATKTEAIAKLPTPVSSWNLVLDGNIGINFVLNVTAEEAANATVELTVNGTTTSRNVAELLTDGKYVLTAQLAAAQMTDAVAVTVKVDGTERSKTYSVRSYADYILADTTGTYTDAAKNLVKYMLAYGAASQTYFGYNTGNLADSGLTVEAASVPTEGGAMEVSGKVSGLKLYGATLVHENKIAVRFYFTGSIEGLTFSQGTAQQKGDKYYIEIADICPQDLDQDIVISVTDGSNTLTVTYSALDYIIRMYGKGGNVAPLVQALYGYHVAAEAYTG